MPNNIYLLSALDPSAALRHRGDGVHCICEITVIAARETAALASLLVSCLGTLLYLPHAISCNAVGYVIALVQLSIRAT